MLRNVTLCLGYHNTEECDAEDITVLRNGTLCWLKCNNIEECDAMLVKILVLWNMTLYWRDRTLAEYNAVLMKVSQDWGMWRSVDEDITVLQNMTLCLRCHNNEECDALLMKI